LVLPVPAPARMQTGPPGAVTAARCSASNPASTARTRASTELFTTSGIIPARCDVVPNGFPHHPREAFAVLTVYSTPWCGYCHRLVAQLDREGIGCQGIGIESDPAAAAFVMGGDGADRAV